MGKAKLLERIWRPRSKPSLKDRLEHIWESPDFASFFEKTKRPACLIKKGTIIFDESDPLEKLYFIKEGFIKLYRLSEDGRDGTSYLLGPGHIVGLRALLSPDKSAKHNAEALTDIKVVSISREEFFEHAVRDSSLLVDLLHAYIERLDYTEQRLVGFMFTDSTARVAHFLYDCAERYPTSPSATLGAGREIVLPLKLSHQRIADFVGSFRETVTLSLNRLEDAKIIRINKGEIVICDLQKLREYAVGGTP
ncbi:MAG: hypothetical protein A3D24_02860 [Candidatus Blackburnbacteria bacterium RIFCSPHIGHO2_02_FULL_39_13]|uniref:HTH crp-type domain-containing protein n=1 Tax=Candidatus Blackburnbacteria bacterium RIFCSPLOWO2_01_FULL_40_20 TaxID=1797519 RepID=A0A1G1VBK6_9BACT|nr:MAG: hypothetical protein A2694_01765 [Candidatus Blackburnbacteria bacterium RIFCSPHIGHO2_01_FULL_40_17]OGY07764.1 MAG: hypothetical protein A3D24_02860 [Candidatus Blackburnbacteria bacterium RIFCSPHIGHO2_02_FULL_39_13]OGY12823.1 MAG: hypothetical protein A3A77_03025 [Candidatus Blackburnbacteria bacterium RIFCSPLOWO2_01_FULL_40_20]